MNKMHVPFAPLVNFASVFSRNRPVDLQLLPNLSPWLVKLILLEPVRWLEYVRYHKQINTHQPQPPLFILGHWRSGTTYLQNLLRQDPQFGYFNVFGSVLPEIFLGTERVLKPFFQKVVSTLGVHNKFHRLPFDWDFPGEEDVALTALSIMENPHWGHLFPRQYAAYANKFLFLKDISQPELRRLLDAYVYVVKKISLRNNGKPLVLKSPPNTARIKHLLRIYPQAKFIYIHRNPFEVYYSNLKFWQVTEGYSFQRLTEVEKEKIIIYTYQQLIEAYLQQKEYIPENNLVEVRYEALVSDPIGQLQAIYRQLQLNFTPIAEAAIKQYIGSDRSFQQQHYPYNDQAISTIQHHWAFSLRHWAYKPPIPPVQKPLKSNSLPEGMQ
jgi:hypothetical protein